VHSPDLEDAGSSAAPPLLLLPPADPRRSAPVPLDPVLLAAGVGVAMRSLARVLFGWKRYAGGVEAICRAVLEDCWNGQYIAGSAGHFRQFWTRDLAMCTPALCRLGMRDRVVRSWEWGLQRFEAAGRITTTIFARRFARDVYAYACDSLPMLLFGLEAAGAEHLIQRHKALLSREVERYYRKVFDPELGLARPDGYFSGPRDCMTGRSTVFANTMIALLGRQLERADGLPRPLAGHDLQAAMRRHYWTGDSFRDSLDRTIPSGDANVWPFFFGIFEDRDMWRRAFGMLEAGGFTDPVPMRYFQRRLPEAELPVPRLFTPNYQGDPSWTQLGPAYLHLLQEIDRPKMHQHRAAMAALIERDRNYLELYEKGTRPYRGRALLYHADEGMIWAAMFLDLY
jgi:hypothetical protein